MKKKINKDKMVAYAYVGEWYGGELGWILPESASNYDTIKNPQKPDLSDKQYVRNDETFHLCRITIERVKEKPKGRRLVRSAKSIRQKRNCA